MSAQNEERGERWLARSRTGFLVSVLSFAIPILLSIAAAFGASMLLFHPSSDLSRVLWWVIVLAIAWLAAVIGERIARPLLPLASLLKMSLLFPDRAPSRFAVAWRSGSTRQLDRYVHGLDDTAHREPVTAAMEILTLVTALSSHDRRTRGHSERVRAYTDLLADELRLPLADRDRLRWSALLHDVGKITVDVAILNKPGVPSEAEWEILHQHPLEGKRMIEPLREWLGEWGLAVEQHHENFDGTGYPHGIAGDHISLGARIVAVADAFEVMTAARSYKSAMSPSAARKELTRCAGTQFDPAIVRAFLNISVGRQRLVIGPLAWIFDVPIISQMSNLGNVFVASSQVALVAGSVTLGAVAAGGQVLMHPHVPSPISVVATATHPLRHPGVLAGATVVPDPTSIAAHVSPTTVAIGAEIYPSATISGGSSLVSGSVTFDIYNNDSCANGGLVSAMGPVAVTHRTVSETSGWAAVGPPGTYYVVALYTADATHRNSRSGCADAGAIVTGPNSPTTTSTNGAQPTTATSVPPGTPTTSTTTTTTTTKPPTPTTTTSKPPAPTTTTTKPPAPTTTTTKAPSPTTTTTTVPPPTTTTTRPCVPFWHLGCPLL
ncbi:MAG: HD-GYP domain-containing protein [Acidimicrobiales bacterium]